METRATQYLLARSAVLHNREEVRMAVLEERHRSLLPCNLQGVEKTSLMKIELAGASCGGRAGNLRCRLNTMRQEQYADAQHALQNKQTERTAVEEEQQSAR
jgi:hypothetical protein